MKLTTKEAIFDNAIITFCFTATVAMFVSFVIFV